MLFYKAIIQLWDGWLTMQNVHKPGFQIEHCEGSDNIVTSILKEAFWNNVFKPKQLPKEINARSCEKKDHWITATAMIRI